MKPEETCWCVLRGASDFHCTWTPLPQRGCALLFLPLNCWRHTRSARGRCRMTGLIIFYDHYMSNGGETSLNIVTQFEMQIVTTHH